MANQKYFTDLEIQTFGTELQNLEAIEPTICAWRYQGGGPGSRFSRIKARLRDCRDLIFHHRRLPRPKKGQIVFVSDGPTDASFGNLRAVIRELNSRGQTPFLVTTRKTRRFLAEDIDVDHVDIAELFAAVPFAERRLVDRKVRQFAPSIVKLLGDRDGGTHNWLRWGLLARTIARSWIGDAGAIVLDADHEAWRKGFVLGAADSGVPSLMLQHGTWGPMMFPLHVTVTACWGEISQRELLHFRVRPERIVPLGSPRWDHLAKMSETPAIAEDRVHCGGSPTRPLVLLISNTHVASKLPNLYEPYFEGVARLLESNKFDVVVKLHPSERGLDEYSKRIPSRLMARLHVSPTNLGLHRPLKACDVVYHVGSAASLEAILLRVPVLFEAGINTNPPRFAPPNFGGGEWVTPKELTDRVSDLYSSRKSREELLLRQSHFLRLALANLGAAAKAVTDYLDVFPQTGRRLLGVDIAR
jgi:hypothetical protein